MAKEAIENVKRIVEYLDVQFTILRYDYSDIFREALLKAQSPCRRCPKRIMKKLRKYALKKDVKYTITGHELPFDHPPYRLMPGGVVQIRLLSLMDKSKRVEILKKLLSEFLKLVGYTTNCLILDPTLEMCYEKHGFSFEYRRIAVLVRYGLLDKEKALEKVKKPEI